MTPCREKSNNLAVSHHHRIDKVQDIDLAAFSTRAPKGHSKEEGVERTKKLGEELGELQELLFYAGRHSLLVVLQGMDTSGKDGTIRHLLNCTNVQSTRVAPFKVPTSRELAHDFLWRVHQQTPGKGEVVVFNRSHYEDVLVVRVHELVPEKVWRARYDHINAFERLLVDADTIVVKFFLHISKDEQQQRLIEREQEVEKAWKLSVGDWKERELWDDYQKACGDAIGKCTSAHAPWHVVPSDQKWYRNMVVTEALVEVLRGHKQGWMDSLEELGQKAKTELATYRATQA